VCIQQLRVIGFVSVKTQLFFGVP